jgi:hypothetical protein
VNDAVWCVILLVQVVDAHLDHGLARNRVAHLQRLRERRPAEYRLAQSKHLEHAEHVGAELYAGADLLELRRLRENSAVRHPMPARESERHLGLEQVMRVGGEL